MSLTVQAAAAEIVCLINSRTRSPRPDELEEIIARVASAPADAPAAEPGVDARRAALHDAIAAIEEANPDVTDIAELERPLSALSEAVWSRPARTAADLHERALIARHWHNVDCAKDDGTPLPRPWVNPADCEDWGDRAIAELIHAALHFQDEGQFAVADGSIWRRDVADYWKAPIVKEARSAIARWILACEASDVADEEAQQAAVDAAHERLTEVVARIWATTPTTWADVVARALIFEHWSPAVDDTTGVLTYLDPAALAAEQRSPLCDWSAEAHLLDAIRKVSRTPGTAGL